MGTLLRKLRGILGTAVSWAVAWGVLGAAYGVVLGIRNPRYWELANPILDTGIGLAVAGFIAGSGFGGLLGWLDRTKTLESLSRARVAAWGAAGGALVPVLVHLTRGLTSSAGWTDVAMVALVTGGLGCLSAVGTVRLALKAPGQRSSLGAGASAVSNDGELHAAPEPAAGGHGYRYLAPSPPIDRPAEPQ